MTHEKELLESVFTTPSLAHHLYVTWRTARKCCSINWFSIDGLTKWRGHWLYTKLPSAPLLPRRRHELSFIICLSACTLICSFLNQTFWWTWYLVLLKDLVFAGGAPKISAMSYLNICHYKCFFPTSTTQFDLVLLNWCYWRDCTLLQCTLRMPHLGTYKSPVSVLFG